MERNRHDLRDEYTLDYLNAPWLFDDVLQQPERFGLHPHIRNLLVAFENVLADSNWTDWMTIHGYCWNLMPAIKDGYRTIAYIVASRQPIFEAESQARLALERADNLEEQVESCRESELQASLATQKTQDLEEKLESSLRATHREEDISYNLGEEVDRLEGMVQARDQRIEELEHWGYTLCKQVDQLKAAVNIGDQYIGDLV
jgi:chromosome segregation ATPase